MSDFPELDVLVDAFPTYPRSELASRLLCSSSTEVLFDELLIEAENGIGPFFKSNIKTQFHPDVDKLKEFLPTINKDNLAAALHRHNGNLEKTIEYLLETDPLQKLSKLSALEEKELQIYLSRNSNNVLRALADVISNYKRRKKVRASRVQARNGASAIYQDAYILHDNDTELLQLKECVWAENALREINYDFLTKSLVFYQGDVSRVLDISRLYIEAKCQSITFDHQLGFKIREVPPCCSTASLLLSRARPFCPKLGETVKPTILLPKYNASVGGICGVNQSRAAQASLINGSRSKSNIKQHPVVPKTPVLAEENTKVNPSLINTKRLDLHGFTVVSAVSATKAALMAWWKEEKECRVAEGYLDRYGSRAIFMEPLYVITGRGIHSAGGASKIRSSVIKFLNEDGYLFDEYMGSVSVFGKK